jgi:hypothetical protein
LTGATASYICETPVLVTGQQYRYRATFGFQAPTGTQGIQCGIQCTVSGASVQGISFGSQGTQGIGAGSQTTINGWIVGPGLQGYQFGTVASALGFVIMEGLITMPSSGSPQCEIVVEALQSSVTGYIHADAHLELIPV